MEKEISVGEGIWDHMHKITSNQFNKEYHDWMDSLGTFTDIYGAYSNHWRNQIKFADPDYRGN